MAVLPAGDADTRAHATPVRAVSFAIVRARPCSAAFCVASLALFAACPPASNVCNVDNDCPRFQVCTLGACADEPAGEGEGAAAGEGEGEGASTGEGEGEGEGAAGEGEGAAGEGEGAAGEGEGAAGEGEGAAGEGEGAAGEGEGAAGEGEGEGTANQPPLLSIVPARGLAGTAINFRISATDPDGDTVPGLRVGQQPRSGVVTIAGTNITYTSSASFTGDDSFTVIPTDSQGLDGPAANALVHVLPSDWADLGMFARARIDIDATAAPPNGSVTNLAVYVSLTDPALVAFARDAVRFADANQDSLDADLDHDSNGEIAYWVRVPSITGGIVQSIFVYAGGSATSLAPPSATGTWPDYLAVYHLTDLHDATGNHADLVPNGSFNVVSCALGSCLSFNGNGVAVIGSSLADLAGQTRCTLSASAAPATSTATTNDVASWTVHGNAGVSRAFLGYNGASAFQAGSRTSDTGSTDFADFTVSAATGVEARIDAVFDVPHGEIAMFQNGAPAGVVPLTNPPAAFPSTPSDGASIGGTANGSFPFTGHVDEVRLSLVARDADFLTLDALSRANQLAQVGAVEQ
jgi:hypothetical protein